ncbi:MAG TPA: hypothetical protein PLU30_16585 [Verrucomicrobiae bacterium]|nr:hypothetical protein [Verrucomicrobiae bacterium]
MNARFLFAIAGMAGSAACAEDVVLPETTLFEIYNLQTTLGNPTSPSICTSRQPWRVTRLTTCHYQAGGTPPGTMWLVDGSGSNWGPWQATPGESTLFEIDNPEGVQSNPTSPSVFNNPVAWRVTRLMTYHYLNGGIPPGTMWLVDGSGSNWGPWQATGRTGQGGVPNAYWDVEINPAIILPPDTYTIQSSSPETWSHNAQSGGRGMCRVSGGTVDGNPYWDVDFDPGLDLPPGIYTFQVSSPETWSHNAQSAGRGMCRVSGSFFLSSTPPIDFPGRATEISWLAWKIDDDPRVSPSGTLPTTPTPIVETTLSIPVAAMTGGVHRLEIIAGGATNGSPSGAGMLCVSPFHRFRAPSESPVARLDWAFDGSPLVPESSVAVSPPTLAVETNIALPASGLDPGTHRLGLVPLDGGGAGGMLYTSPFHVSYPSVGGLRDITLDVVLTNHAPARGAIVKPISGAPTIFEDTVTWPDFRLRASGSYLLRAKAATTADIGGPWVWTQFDQSVPAYREELNLSYWPPEAFPGVSVAFGGDANGDGTPNGLAFALGVPPDQRAQGFLPDVLFDVEYLYYSFRQRSGGTGDPGAGYSADGVSYHVEISGTLLGDSWLSGPGLFDVVGTPIDNGDGTETVTIRIQRPEAGRLFVRLRCDEAP